MPEYRTPDEEQAQEQHEVRVHAVLDQAVRDGASLVAAMALDEPADVVELWIDRLWDGLRDNLVDGRPDRCGMRQDDRLKAIVLLLTDRMRDEGLAIVRSVMEVGDA